VADQQLGRGEFLAQEIGGGDQVFDVGREIGVGEFAVAGTEAGEIEAQHGHAERGQALRDAGRGQHVLAAGEAVGEQAVGARRAVGVVQLGEILPWGPWKSMRLVSMGVGARGDDGAMLPRSPRFGWDRPSI
jgi:hypothetical protein